jgi:hypothetical protein
MPGPSFSGQSHRCAAPASLPFAGTAGLLLTNTGTAGSACCGPAAKAVPSIPAATAAAPPATAISMTTSNTDGRGDVRDGDDRILRFPAR